MCQFISVSANAEIPENFILHMENLVNVKFTEADSVGDVMSRLKDIVPEQIAAIDEWISLQDEGVMELDVLNVFMDNEGFAVFNFIKDKK